MELLTVCRLSSHSLVVHNVVANRETAEVSDSDFVASKELRLIICQLRFEGN